ncbi:MAG: metal ABC transporter permease [Chloroflexi bacterium]|nr:metal ABC transporter permease [Chloroflexota bacterium]
MTERRVWQMIAALLMLGVLLLPLSQALFGLRLTYTVRVVALGGSLLGALSGALGCFAVLRRESLLGDALSHAALPGVAVGFLLAGRQLGALLVGAGIASWLGLRLVAAILRTTRIKQDAALGIVLASFFAAGIALLTYIQSLPDASQAGLDSFIFGQAAAIIESDIALLGGIGLAVAVVLALLWKEFKLLTFDADFASAGGLRGGLINALLSTLIVVTIVLGLQLAGVILMVGMLIAPAIAARQWTHSLEQMVVLAAALGAFAGGSGAVISALDSDIPTGPMIIVVAFALVLLSITLAPGRGVIWSQLRQRENRRNFRSRRLEPGA